MRAWSVGLFSSMVWVWAAGASAQCAPGRVATEATGGRCCWPGQTWDDAANRCDGAPQCPEGFGGAGADCVALAPPPAPETERPAARPSQPAYALQAPPPPPQAAAPYGGAPWQMPMHESREPLPGLWITGTVLVATAYAYSLVIGSIFIDTSSCDAQNSWSMYIPLVGGFVWPALAPSCYYSSSVLADFLGIPGAGVQVIGLGLMLAGLIARRTVRRPDWTPRVSAGPGQVGLGLTWDL